MKKLKIEDLFKKGIGMKILYGTTNKAKLQAMRNALESFDIELIGLGDIDSELPSINEDGKTPLENAEIKARAYYKAFHIPVFSCDNERSCVVGKRTRLSCMVR